MSRAPVLLLVLIAGNLLAVEPKKPGDWNAKRPIEAHDTVFVEEMTWMEVRDALKAGKTTVIVPTGGVEQNGPYLATGKHNYIVRASAEIIARKLGNALVAPVVPFVPEGDIDPPSGHMQYPGTISLSEDTYERLLADICASFRAHGFTDIVLIGDSGGNQNGMEAVAARLTKTWAKGKVRVHFIAEYYDYDAVDDWLAKAGIREVDEGFHDGFAISAPLIAIDPTLVRAKPRQKAGNFSINGIALAPIGTSAEWGRKILAFRADATVTAIHKAIGK